MDRYGEAIEYDLHHECGIDILDFFRGRLPWGKLERLINRLQRVPRSHLQVAMAMDTELAEASLEKPKQQGIAPSGPPLEEYSPEVARLSDLTDRVSELIGLVYAVAYRKTLHQRPLPRPKTAFDLVREAKRLERHLDLVAEVEEAQRRWLEMRQG